MSTITATLLDIILSVPVAPVLSVPPEEPVPVAYEITTDEWRMEEGDKVIVDTLINEGYLMHEDGRYIRFHVVTGQRRRVYYIGRSYNAATPNWNWTARSLDIKGDRVTFGPSGRFLRLYKDGEENTAYGFHEHRDETEMFSGEADERFRSMGCIIVQSHIMDLLVATWMENGEELPIITKHGIESLQEVMLAFGDNTEAGQEGGKNL